MTKVHESLAKLARPQSRNVFRRDSLLKKLDTALSLPSVWISGPPGSGKTTLISNYLDERDGPVIWYQIDESDSDIATFFCYLKQAAGSLTQDTKDELPQYSSAYRGGIATFTANFFAMLYQHLPHGFIIVLDDFHLADPHKWLGKVIFEAIQALPRHGSIVVTSRQPLPSRYCRLLGNDRLALIDNDDLRLTTDEIRGIAENREMKFSTYAVDEFAERSAGWAAGLIFQLNEACITDVADAPAGEFQHEQLFGYFATEVLEQRSPETQSIIARLALLPHLTQDMACEFTGNDRAGIILDWLYRHNYFVELQTLDRPVYRFHPLFRGCLLDRLYQELGRTKVLELRLQAAQLIEASGFASDAADLYAAVGNWDKVIELVNAEAVNMLHQGRSKTLARRISRIPADIILEHPRLSYWLGMCRKFSDGHRSHQDFSVAFEGFSKQGDHDSAIAAWAGAVYALLADWGDMKAVDEWITRGEDLISVDVESPVSYNAAQAISAMCFALFLTRPNSPALPAFVEKTQEILVSTKDLTFSLMGANLLMIFYAWQGENSKSRMLLEAIRPEMEKHSVGDMHHVMWAAALGWFEMASGHAAKCIKTSTEAQQLADKSGIHIFDYRFCGLLVQANLLAGNADEAWKNVHQYLKMVPRGANLIAFHVNHLAAWTRWSQGHVSSAREYLAMARQLLEAGGSPPVIDAKVDLAYAVIHFQEGNTAEGMNMLSRAHRVAVATGSTWLKYHCALLEADIALNAGRRKRCASYLSDAFAIAREQELTTTDWWNPARMSELCDFALGQGIETEYVAHIILTTNLRPPATQIQSPDWPWPVKIELLGKFRITINGTELRGRAAGQTKAMELLKVLLAKGGSKVSLSHLADALWPDADGDDARNSLKTTIHRLRRLLEIPEALQLSNGFLSLQQEYCWCDTQVVAALATTPQSSSQRLPNLKRALELCRGTVLENEEATPWILAARKEMQRIAHEVVMEMGVRYETKSKWNKAIATYTKGLGIDPTDEQAYRHLMLCYQRIGQQNEAIAVYERCCDELKLQFDRVPTSRTLALAESIIQA